MYHSWNIRRFLRYAAFDLALILAALLLTHAGKQHFAAVDSTGGVTLPILMYHSVTDMPETDYCISPETFRQDLQYLHEHGYETVSAAELIAYTKGNGSMPSKPIMLTFDDGFYNNMSIALPILEEYDMCAVISIVGAFTDVYAPDAPHNDVYSYLTWDDLRQLQESGHIELGSHTYDMHSNDQRKGCAKLEWESEETYHSILYEDVSMLQSRFQEELQMQPVIFAYPYGFISKESKPVLKECGFRITLTCLEKPNFITRDPSCLYGLSRYNRPGNCSTEQYMSRVISESNR